jgi:hypothetical protein
MELRFTFRRPQELVRGSRLELSSLYLENIANGGLTQETGDPLLISGPNRALCTG